MTSNGETGTHHLTISFAGRDYPRLKSMAVRVKRKGSEGEATVYDPDRKAPRRYSVQFGPVWKQEPKLIEWQHSALAKQSPLPFHKEDCVSTCQTCHMRRKRVIDYDYGATVGGLASYCWLRRQRDGGEVLRLGYSGTRFSPASSSAHSEFGRKYGLARTLTFSPRPARRSRNREFLAHLA
jgi:hypothetical protein